MAALITNMTNKSRLFMSRSLVVATRTAERLASPSSLRMFVAGVCMVVATVNIIRQESWAESTRGAISIYYDDASRCITTSDHHHDLVHEHYYHLHDNSTTTTTKTTSTATDHNDNKQQRRMPLFIGAGQGTTGTRSMYRAFCHLGIPSVHWSSYCIDNNASPLTDDDADDDDENGSSGGGGGNSSSSSSLLLETAIQHHYQAIQTYLRLGNCAIFHRQRQRQRLLQENNTLVREEIMTCTDEEFGNLATKLHVHVAQVVKSGGMIASLHDVPYAQMVPFIMDIARQESIPTLLIMSERDPEAWVASRTLKHASQTDVVCQDDDDDDVEHAFDITHCLQKWKEGRLVQSNNNNTTDGSSSNNNSNENGADLSNFFRAYNEFPEGSDERAHFLDFAARAMAHHQEQILRNMSPIYHVNFWNETSRIDDVTLPGKIWRSIKDVISPHAKKVYIRQSHLFGLTKTQDDKVVARLEKLDRLRKGTVGDDKKMPSTTANQGKGKNEELPFANGSTTAKLIASS